MRIDNLMAAQQSSSSRPDDHQQTKRWVIIAASGEPAASAFAGARGIHPCLVLTKADLLRHPRTLRAMVREAGAEAALAHSVDWDRQRNPQLYTLALALMPLGERYVADDRTGRLSREDSSRAAFAAFSLPVDGVKAAAAVAGEALRLVIDRPRELR